jgi:hypothetical protein
MAVCLWVGASLLDLPNFLQWGDHTYDMKTMACSYDRLASYSYTVFFIMMFVTVCTSSYSSSYYEPSLSSGLIGASV